MQVLFLFEQTIRRKGEDALTLLSVVAAPNSSKEAIEQLVTGLQNLAGFRVLAGGDVPSVYDQVDDETHVRLIGSCLLLAGSGWLETHERQADWLRQRSLSPDEAIGRYREWMDRKSARFKELRDAEQHDHIHEERAHKDDQRPGL